MLYCYNLPGHRPSLRQGLDRRTQKKKLLAHDFPRYLLAIIFSFLQNRTFAVKINTTLSETKPIRAGVPQGSILGPLLFNIYTSDIPKIPATLATFADDTAIITQNTNLETATDHLQNATDTLNKWLKDWNITLNPSKCEKWTTGLILPSMASTYPGTQETQL